MGLMRVWIVVREDFDYCEIVEVFDTEAAATENAATRKANNPFIGEFGVYSHAVHSTSYLKRVKRRIGGEPV